MSIIKESPYQQWLYWIYLLPLKEKAQLVITLLSLFYHVHSWSEPTVAESQSSYGFKSLFVFQQHQRTSGQSYWSASRCRPSSIDSLQMSGARPASPLREGRLKQFDGCCIEILKFVAFIYTSVAALNCTFPAGHFLSVSCLSHILSFHILSPLKHSLPLHNSPHSTPQCLFVLNQHFKAVCRLAETLSMELITPHPVSTAQVIKCA